MTEKNLKKFVDLTTRVSLVQNLLTTKELPASAEEHSCRNIIDHLRTDNPTWSIDITYIPIRHGFLYLTAVIDWNSRCIVGWDVDDTLDTRMVINALKKVFKVAKPQILNSDQGCQFTIQHYIDFVKQNSAEHGRQKPLGG